MAFVNIKAFGNDQERWNTVINLDYVESIYEATNDLGEKYTRINFRDGDGTRTDSSIDEICKNTFTFE